MMNFESLLEPQRNHAVTLLNSLYLNGVAFDSSQTGTGKTYVASWIAKQLNVPIVVICPKVAIKTWNTVLSTFGIKADLVINYEKLTRGNTKYYTYNDKEYFKGKTAKAWYMSRGLNVNFPIGSLVIFDEVHRCKGMKSLNSELLVACKNFNYKLLKLSASAATLVTEMKAFGFAANLHQGYNFTNWAYKNGASANAYGALVIDDANRAIEGMKNIHNILNNVYNCASRMTVDMFGSIFPDNQVNANCFDLGTVNTQKFNAITEQMQSELAALDERSKTYKEHVFSVMMRWRRHSELLKVPSMVEWIEETYKEGSSPVVFINFQDTLEAIEKRLGDSYKHLIGKICGGQTDKQRNNDIELFQSDNKRIMLVNIQAGNASVSLHDLNGNYPRRSLINPSWSAINTLQALGRIFRAEGKTKCIQNFMFAMGTIEERMAERVQSKLNNISILNDGDIQLEFNLVG